MRRQIHVRHRGKLNREGRKVAKMYVRALVRLTGMPDVEYMVFSPSVLTKMVAKGELR